jgi:hypothetical protein
MCDIAPYEGQSTHPEPEVAEVKLVPSRRDCYGVVLVLVAICSLAPFRGITFVLLGVAAVELPNLPLTVRFIALTASFCLVGFGIFRILNSV